MTLHRQAPAWLVYLALGALACALYLWVKPFQGSGPVMNLIGLSPVLAIVAGIRRHRPGAGCSSRAMEGCSPAAPQSR